MTICKEVAGNHSPLLLQVGSVPFEEERDCKLTNKYTDWPAFRSWLDQNVKMDISMKTNDEIDNAVEYITKLIQKASWLATPDPQLKTGTTDLPSSIIHLVKKKRKIRKLWQETRYLAHKTELNRISKLLRESITEYKEKMLSRYLEQLSPNDTGSSSFWKTTKYLKYGGNSTLPITKPNGMWARTNQERAEVFADHYHSSFQPNPPSNEIQNINHINQFAGC